jgi:hypothetical protein
MRRRLACAILALALVEPASAQFESVGTLSFPTSGTSVAQQHFLRAVAILHSFGWKQAIVEFKLAQQAQPDFAMAYWGRDPLLQPSTPGGAGCEEPAGRAGATGAHAGGASRQGADGSREGIP